MENSRRLIVWISCLAVVGGEHLQCARGQTPGDSQLKDRFLREAPVAWAKYHLLSTRLQGSITNKAFSKAPKELLLEGRIDFSQGSGGASITSWVVFSKDRASTEQECSTGNSKYHFRLKRRDASSTWALAELGEDVGKDRPEIFGKESAIYMVKGVVTAPIAISSNVKDDWLSMLENPEFKVISVANFVEGGSELCVVEFDFQRNATAANPVCVVGKGRVWYDPKLLWVMIKCEYKLQSAPKGPVNDQIATYQYDVGEHGFPLVKIISLEYLDKNGKLDGYEESAFTLAFADLPERDFTLTTFGLPEPVGVTWPKPTRWWLWISVAASGAIGIAILVVMLKRRYFPASSPAATLTGMKEGAS